MILDQTKPTETLDVNLPSSEQVEFFGVVLPHSLRSKLWEILGVNVHDDSQGNTAQLLNQLLEGGGEKSQVLRNWLNTAKQRLWEHSCWPNPGQTFFNDISELRDLSLPAEEFNHIPWYRKVVALAAQAKILLIPSFSIEDQQMFSLNGLARLGNRPNEDSVVRAGKEIETRLEGLALALEGKQESSIQDQINLALIYAAKELIDTLVSIVPISELETQQ